MVETYLSEMDYRVEVIRLLEEINNKLKKGGENVL